MSDDSDFIVVTGSNVGAVLTAQPTVPTVGALLNCDAVVYDQQHFLDLFDRLFPYDYLAPMKINPNSGYELLQAFAAVGERISQAVEHLECGALVIFSTGGELALVPVIFTRPPPAVGALTIKQSTLVTTPRGDYQFLTNEDLDAPVAGTFTVMATAVANGWQWNVRGQRIAANGEVLEGEIQKVLIFRQDPSYGDPSVTASQIIDAINGKSADLDALADNRGLNRVPAEPDDPFRLRVRSLPDVVSPDAIRRIVTSRLGPLNIPFDIIEVFEHRYQEEYDAPSPNPGTPTFQLVPPPNPDFNPNLFCYDDPRPLSLTRFADVWLDLLEYRGAFLVIVPNDLTLFDFGLAYDDPGMTPADFKNPTTGHQRGTSAYDIPSTAPAALVYVAAYDGYDTERAAVYAGLYQDLQAAKPFGVAALMDAAPRI